MVVSTCRSRTHLRRSWITGVGSAPADDDRTSRPDPVLDRGPSGCHREAAAMSTVVEWLCAVGSPRWSAFWPYNIGRTGRRPQGEPLVGPLDAAANAQETPVDRHVSGDELMALPESLSADHVEADVRQPELCRAGSLRMLLVYSSRDTDDGSNPTASGAVEGGGWHRTGPVPHVAAPLEEGGRAVLRWSCMFGRSRCGVKSGDAPSNDHLHQAIEPVLRQD